MKLTPTSSQTVGPFFSIGMAPLCQNADAALVASPDSVTLHGVVSDGDRSPIPDCVLEFFAEGFFARVATDRVGKYRVILAPAISSYEVLIFMRGLLKPVLTRVFFNDEAMRKDPALQSVPRERLVTLVAHETSGRTQCEWNIAMQGEDEAVFFDF